MLPYGIKKKRFATIHPHNVCSICRNEKVVKNSARQTEKNEIEEHIMSSEYDHNEWCIGEHCDCPYCLGYEYENEGNGWKLVW